MFSAGGLGAFDDVAAFDSDPHDVFGVESKVTPGGSWRSI